MGVETLRTVAIVLQVETSDRKFDERFELSEAESLEEFVARVAAVLEVVLAS
jgi:hypothetical protein